MNLSVHFTAATMIEHGSREGFFVGWLGLLLVVAIS
jgi:hypothetical protein